MNKTVIAVAFGIILSFSTDSNAVLVDRGYGLIYDTTRNITWLQNANFGAGSSFDDGSSSTDGRMTWSSAMAWADSLDFAGYSDWRLPTAEQNCWYQNDCTYGEIGHLYFDEIGATRGSSVFEVSDTTNLDLFINVQPYIYWTSLVDNRYVAYDLGAIGFNFGNGTQCDYWQRNDFFAWAVRDGDVDPVPEPATILLLGSGLAGLAFCRRKRK